MWSASVQTWRRASGRRATNRSAAESGQFRSPSRDEARRYASGPTGHGMARASWPRACSPERNDPGRPASSDAPGRQRWRLHSPTAIPWLSGDEGGELLEASMVVATVSVTDLGRAKRFYGETLGLTFLWENPAPVRFGCGGGTQLSIFRRAPSTADHTLALRSVRHRGGGSRARRARRQVHRLRRRAVADHRPHRADRPSARGVVPRPVWQHPRASPGVAVVHPGGNEPADSSDVVGALPPLPKTRRRHP